MPKGKHIIGRRGALALTAAAALPVRRSAAEAAGRTLRYVPYSNLIVMDPVWSISIIGLEHAYMTCDQLYGLDGSYTACPQMVAGHELSDDKLRWRFTLRNGLRFHDNEKVRAADCVASIARWAKRDPFGQRSLSSDSSWPATICGQAV
jgi:peptide/nickel transport system substrate-binding protein